jgi:hypothetical protein
MAPRPLMAATAQQQKQIEAQQRQIDFLARLAGVEPHVAALRYTADANNPADPVPDPPSQAPSQSTDQARTPEAYDDPRVPGMTPGANQRVPAAATDVPMTPGASLPTSPFGQMVDVSAPVAGTEGTTGAPEFGDQAGRDAVTRIEPDVRALGIGEEGDQMDPTVAFPWTMSPNQSNSAPPSGGEMAPGSGGRAMACLRLAKARLAARLADGDEFSVAAHIESDAAMTRERIADELNTLARVAGVQSHANAGGARRGELVPRRAAAAPRPVVPSLAAASAPLQVLAALGPSEDEIEISDLF